MKSKKWATLVFLVGLTLVTSAPTTSAAVTTPSAPAEECVPAFPPFDNTTVCINIQKSGDHYDLHASYQKTEGHYEFFTAGNQYDQNTPDGGNNAEVTVRGPLSLQGQNVCVWVWKKAGSGYGRTFAACMVAP